MIIEFDGLLIEVTRKPIKNINFRISRVDGSVKVSVPQKFSLKELAPILQQKKAWINSKFKASISSAQYKMSAPLQNGSLIPFLGQHYSLNIHRYCSSNTILINQNYIDYFADGDHSDFTIQTLLEHWYKIQLQTILPKLIAQWELIIPVQSSGYTVKKMSSRWGSCNIKTAKICLNLNLIKKPLICLEYVLVHELIHILEPSHNHRFYQLMDHYMPLWKEHRRLLEHGHV